MKKYYFATLISLLAYCSMAQKSELVDRAIFFGNPEISSGQLSPDGKFVSFMREHNGAMNIWVKAFDAEFSDAKLLTASPSPILGYLWSRDSKFILYVNDNAGDENINVFAVDPNAPAKGEVPPSRNLTPLKDVSAQLYAASRKNTDLLMIGLNDRDKAWHDLYELRISTGKLTKVLENKSRYTQYYFDWDEQLRLASRSDEDGNSQIVKINDDGSFKEVYSTNIKENASISGWTKDNKECYLLSNKGDVDLTSLYKLNPESGQVTLFETDPKGKVDFGGLFINDNTREIISTSYTYDKRVRYFKDKSWEKTFNYLKSKFKGREVGFTSFTKNYSKMLIAVTGDKYASEVYFFDTKSKELILQYTPRPKLKKVEHLLSTMKPIKFKSSDGLEIPAYLSLPVGKEAKNLPTVILVHGGPKGPRDTWGYRGSVQFLTNRGYAVLQPNFRASGGYGKAFLNGGDKQWGKLMQDDITWGVKHLIKEGISDPSKVAIMGGSYGGYATLAGLAFTPDLYACGVDIVGPSNLFTLLESIPAYWEAGRKWLYEMVGDPETEEGKKLLTAASPLFSADKISKPLLIIQGANDPRVKKAEADQIVVALREKGSKVDYLLANDEGHGFRKPLNSMAMYAKIEKFLAKQIGGDYQKDLPDDVAKTLEKLTIDINTVKLKETPKVEALTTFPKIQHDWKAYDKDYNLVIEVQGQTMPMTMKRTVSKEDNYWIISDESTGPMGKSTDIVYFDENFVPVKRNMEQSGQKIEFKYNKESVDLVAMGKEMKLESEGVVLVDGPGYDIFFAELGLKKGEKVSFYVVDMMTMKTKQVVAESKDQEEIDGVAYDVILVTSLENEMDATKIWLDGKNKEAIKIEQTIPAMGNAKMTMTRK